MGSDDKVPPGESLFILFITLKTVYQMYMILIFNHNLLDIISASPCIEYLRAKGVGMIGL
jgi:hypothetical protein